VPTVSEANEKSLNEKIAAGEAVSGAEFAAARADIEIAEGGIRAAEREALEAQKAEQTARTTELADEILAWNDSSTAALAADLEAANEALMRFATNVAVHNARRHTLRMRAQSMQLEGVIDYHPLFGITVKGRNLPAVTGFEHVADISARAIVAADPATYPRGLHNDLVAHSRAARPVSQ
jgi:hypothetical protein